MKPAPVAHQFTIYGTGLYTWSQNGGVFSPKVVDNNSSTNGATWGPWITMEVEPNNNGNGLWDSELNFYASETGSMPNSTGSLTITVTLSGNGCLANWSWSPQSVTYISS
jgi:hypothetical protein